MTILSKNCTQISLAGIKSFYKLSTICKRIKIACGRVEVYTKLATAYKRYVLKVLDSEANIEQLKELREKVTQARAAIIEEKNNGHVTPTQLSENFRLYLSGLESRLEKMLEQWEVKVILKEVFDDCLSVMTNEGHIQYENNIWQVRCDNELIVQTKHLDLAIESLVCGEDKTIGW